MKLFLSRLIIVLSLFFIISATTTVQAGRYYRSTTNTTYSNERYDPYASTIGTECNFSSASVGVGTLPDGVIVTIDSPDYAVTQCIKNTTWVSYFTNYGNTVNVNASNTTLGVQIVATSIDGEVSAKLKNTQWSRLITGRSSTYTMPTYTTRNTPRYTQRYYPPRQTYNPPPVYPTYPQYPNDNYYYYTPSRTYVAGSSIWNTYQMYRTLGYQSNGVKMTFSSPDYNTMRQLQGYYFTGLFADLSGISVSIVNIAGGVEVTVTSGSTSTTEQIQRIGYALVYN